MSFRQSVKNAKRRTIQNMMSLIGRGNYQNDEHYDYHREHFDEMVEDIDEIGAGLTQLLVDTKQSFATGMAVSEVVNAFYNGRLNHDWKEVSNALQFHDAAAAYYAAWEDIHRVQRSSAAAVCRDTCLVGLRDFVNRNLPEVQRACDQRDDTLTDVNAYQRKVKAHAEKDPESMPNYEQETQRWQTKLRNAEDLYTQRNAVVKEEIFKAKLARDSVLDICTVTLVVAQAEMFKAASDRLQAVVDQLPQQQVDSIRRQMGNYIAQGGAQAAKVEESAAKTALNLATGKTVLSDLHVSEEERRMQEAEEEFKLRSATELAQREERQRAAGSRMPSAGPGAAAPARYNGGGGPARPPPPAPNAQQAAAAIAAANNASLGPGAQSGNASHQFPGSVRMPPPRGAPRPPPPVSNRNSAPPPPAPSAAAAAEIIAASRGGGAPRPPPPRGRAPPPPGHQGATSSQL